MLKKIAELKEKKELRYQREQMKKESFKNLNIYYKNYFFKYYFHIINTLNILILLIYQKILTNNVS